MINLKYDIDEKRFFQIAGIEEIKSYEKRFEILEYTDGFMHSLINIDITYLNLEYEELNVSLSMPIEINATKDEEVELKEISLEVVENEGVNVFFLLSIEILDEKREESPISFAEEKEEVESFERQTLDTSALGNEIVNNNISNELEMETIEEKIAKEELNEVTILEGKKEFLSLKTSYETYKAINLIESQFNNLSNLYKISLEKLYEKKKSGERLIVKDES